MTLRPSTIYADAWAAWKADWNILTAVAGMFVFLPRLAMALVVPAYPDASKVTRIDSSDPAFQAFVAAVQNWTQHYGLLAIGSALIVLFGELALVAVYLAARRTSVGESLMTTVRLLPRYVLATIIWQLPLGMLGLLLLPVSFLILPLMALALARTLLIGPAILAARPIGAVAAIGRSFVLTRGNMLLLASVVLSVVLAQYLVAMPFVALDQWMANHAPNPIARVIVDALAAGVAALGATAMALVQVAAWRRLNSSPARGGGSAQR